MATKFEMKPQKNAEWTWEEYKDGAQVEAVAVMRVTVPFEGKWQPCKLHLTTEDVVALAKLPEVQELVRKAQDGEA